MDKKLSEYDLGWIDDSLTIIMDLLHIEIHSWKSFNQTKNREWLEINERARIERTNLLEKICDKKVLENDGEIWCFIPETEIITKEGMRSIRDVGIGNLVLTHKGRWRKVTEIIKRSYKGEMIFIKTGYSNIPLSVTPNHLFYVAENVRTAQDCCWKKDKLPFKFVWKEAERLTEKDFLYLPLYKNEDNLQNVNVIFESRSNNQFGKPNKPIIQMIDMNLGTDLMRLIGFYISEGSYSRNENKMFRGRIMKSENLQFTFSSKEKEYADFVVETLKKYFDYNTTYHQRGSTLNFNFGKRIICKFFSQFGNNARSKDIPSWVFGLSNEKLAGLVKGLIEGDGHKDKYSFTYATISKKLAYNLRLILSKLGIISSISNRGKMRGGRIGERVIRSNSDTYIIQVSGDSARRLAILMQEDYSGGKVTNGSHTYINEDFMLIPIKKIEKRDYSGEVFNLSVEEDESYCTFNGVAHNCFNKHSLRVVAGYVELGNRKLTEKKIEEAITYFDKASSWLGVFLIKNKIKEG